MLRKDFQNTKPPVVVCLSGGLDSSILLAMTLAQATTGTAPAPGVSEELARERAGAIRDLKYELTFVAEKPPPAYALEQVALMADASQHSWRRVIGSMSAAEESGEYE
jgi:asparagine synthetase B (glutamine-hydrolysing)